MTRTIETRSGGTVTVTDAYGVGVNPNATSPDAEHTLGTKQTGEGGIEWIYLKAGAAIAAGFVASFVSDVWTAALVTNAHEGRQIGVAELAVPNGHYAWFRTQGPADIQVAANATAGTALYTTVVAGQLDDSVGAGREPILGLRLEAAKGAGAGLARATLSTPRVGN